VEVPDYRRVLWRATGDHVGIPREYFGEGLDSQWRQRFALPFECCKDAGPGAWMCRCPNGVRVAAYYIIAGRGELNLAAMTGQVRIPPSARRIASLDMYQKSRSGIGPE